MLIGHLLDFVPLRISWKTRYSAICGENLEWLKRLSRSNASVNCKGYFLRVSKLSSILCHHARVICKNEYVQHLSQNKFLRIPENVATLLRGNTSCNRAFPLQINFWSWYLQQLPGLHAATHIFLSSKTVLLTVHGCHHRIIHLHCTYGTCLTVPMWNYL